MSPAPVSRAVQNGVQILSQPAPRTLGYNDFTADNAVASHLTRLAYHEVPATLVQALKVGVPFRLQLKGKATVTAAGGAPETIDVSSVFTQGFAVPAHGDGVLVYVNGVLTAHSNVQAAAATVDVATAAGDTVVVYALPNQGEVHLRLERPGVGGAVPLYNQTCQALNSLDQASGETAPRLEYPGVDTLPFAPLDKLSVYVNSAVPMVWEADAGNAVKIDTTVMRVKVLSTARLRAAFANVYGG